ncbi:MAG TPA: hypothetical protein VN253_00130 [Kofleriaceae bacterium]|nr:hypothetical protein [Kofleriaceae bacterium]
MRGRQHGPLLSPDQASRLLDGVIFTRIAELIDLPRLYDLEAMIALQIESLGADRDRARTLAKAMIDRALLRVARTSRGWPCRDGPAPGDGACDLCGGPLDGTAPSAGSG